MKIESHIKEKLKKMLLVIVAMYIMIGASLYFLQERILFIPTVLPQDFQYEFNRPFEELFLKTADDAVINALHFKAENSKGVILYFHGNAGDLSDWGSIAEIFVNWDYDVFIMDYRTYGKSTGKLSEAAFYQDAQFCYDYLKESYSASEITLYGRSLGTGIAAYLASENNAKLLILETPYYSMVDMAKSRFPLLPVKHILQYKFPTNDFIASVECPIVIFHGTDDGIVPFKSGKKLLGTIPKSQATFVKIERGGHNNLIEFEAYRNGIKKILQ